MTRGTRSTVGVAVGFGLLLLLAVAITVSSPALVPTLGIVVVAAALFLDVRATALVGVVAIAVAAVLLFGFGLDHAWERLLNVTLAAVLATLAAWALDRWVRRTAQLQRRESAVLAATPSGLAVIDGSGTVISTNPALTALVPVSAGDSLHEALHHRTGDGQPCTAADCPLLRPTGVAAGNGYGGPSPTRQVPIDWAVTPLDDSRFVATLTDVTLRVTADQERRAVALAAEQQADQRPTVPAAATADGLGVDVGGDVAGTTAWDLTALPDGEVLVLGAQADDPAGAARDTWKVLYIARAYVAAGVPLADVVRRVSESVSADGPTAPVRLLALTLDPLTGHLTFVGGDAAPVLVVRGSGAAEWLTADGGSIGSVTPGSRALASTTITGADTVVIPSPGALTMGDASAGAVGIAAAAVALRRRELAGMADAVLAGLPQDSSGRAGALLLRVAAG